jgi:GYF domain 2/Domain of unknown function (DUF4282)
MVAISEECQKTGSISSVDLKELAANGTVLPSDLVWKQDWPEWKAASSIKGLFGTAAPATPPPTRKAPEAIRAATQAADEVSQKLWFLDLKFEEFATPRLIGFVFVAALSLLPLVASGVLGYAFLNLPVIKAVFVVIVDLIGLTILAIGLRVFLEFCFVGFRIAEHLSYLRYLETDHDDVVS